MIIYSYAKWLLRTCKEGLDHNAN